VKHTNKFCTSCNTNKLVEDWYKNKSRTDGLDVICKSCRKNYNSKRTPEDHLKYSPTNNPLRMYVNGKYVSKTHPLYKPGRYKTFEGAAFSALSNYEKSNKGHVYLITNPAWKGWVKVGMAVDANDRCNQYQTSSPMRDYKLEYKKQFNHRRIAESQAHKLCSKKALQQNGEWFKINIKDAINLIESITEEQNERETA